MNEARFSLIHFFIIMTIYLFHCEELYGCLKVPLKRNFRMCDFCLIIKFEPYLEILPTFFLHAVSENCFFSCSKLTG